MKKYHLIFLFLLHSFVSVAQDCNCALKVTPNKNYLDGSNYSVQPGDTICIMAGNYQFIQLKNFHGSQNNRIVIINCGGLVTIGDPNFSYGFVLKGSTFFHVTGTGHPDYKYGIKINHHGFVADGLSNEFEIDHLESYKSAFAGFMAKTDPQCNDPATWKENFVMKNIKIHNNVSSESHGEGFYIGFSTNKRECVDQNNNKFTIYPHVIEGLEFYNNTVKSSGWDGIQISKAEKNCNIYNNYIINYAQANETAQKYGLILGTGTSGRIYNNTIIRGNSNTTGSGIAVFATRDNIIFNNLIVDAGEDGIFCDDRTVFSDEQYNHVHIINNTIIRPGRDGYRSYSQIPQGTKLYNNLIVAPGSLGQYPYNKNREYLFLHKDVTYDTANNVCLPVFDERHFRNPDGHNFFPTMSSPSIDKGRDVSSLGISMDLKYRTRPIGQSYDAGAFEYTDSEIVTALPNKKEEKTKIYAISNEIFITTSEFPDHTRIKVYDLLGKEIPAIINNIEINDVNKIYQLQIADNISRCLIVSIMNRERKVNKKIYMQP